jgi:hypothetical protein
MRDFERLEELSSTVRSGLKANGVIWAIDQALAGSELDEKARRSLVTGGVILRMLADPGRALQVEGGPRRSQNMLGGEGARNVRSVVVVAANLGDDEGNISKVLTELADILDGLSKDEPAQPHCTELESALEIFSEISEFELGQANGIVRTRKKQTPWLPRTTISTSS